jgi:hypothetical protein
VTVALSVALLVVAFVAPAIGQTDQGRITGTVRDSSNAVMPGATVVVRSERTGEERQALTNDQGRFLVAALKPTSYSVAVTAPGFSSYERTGITLAVGQELSMDLAIAPSGVTESVQVKAEPPVVDLSSARMGVNVSEREVQNLPVNGRQMSQLLLQAPGSQNAGTGTWQDIRFSGRAVEQNVIRYDGVEGSAIIDAAPGNLNGEIPTPFKLQASLENVQEFRVESNSYPAEYGTGTGGQVNIVTKSGSNSVHGGAFEYLRNDRFDAPNYFDFVRSSDGTAKQSLGRSLLRQNQFGGSIGGPIVKDKAFFFGSYEGYRLRAGLNTVEAVPSASAWARAVPQIAALRPGFLAAGAVILPGASANPDFDIAQLRGVSNVEETSVSGRLDLHLATKWTGYLRFFHDQGTNDQPEGVTGRVVHITDNPTNVVFALQGILSSSTIHEFKVGYNAAPTRIDGLAPTVNGIDFSRIAINLSGSVANTGIAGQGSSSGIAVPGGLVRANSATNGHGQPYDPYSLSFIDSMNWLRNNHYVKIGGEFRMVRMATDRIGGTTYTFANLTNFLANQAQTVQYLGDVSAPSPFNNGATGERHTRQEYYVAYAQDEWRIRPSLTMNYGVRYDYYAPLREANNLIVKFNIDTGQIDPNTTPLFKSRKDNFQPRVSMTWAPQEKTVVRGGFGIFVGPGQTEDQIQPVESDRISSTLSNQSFPIDTALLVNTFVNNPNNRAYQPRAYAKEYTIPERIYSYTASVQRELPGRMTATAAYVGSRGRNLFLRSVANQITEAVTTADPTKAAIVVREWSIVQRDANGNITGVQNPYAEVDYKTSGGHDAYNAMQLSVSRRSPEGLAINAQYTLSKSYGSTGGSNEALTSGNLARTLGQFEYDLGYNMFDVRHTFNLSAIYSLPFGKGRRHDLSALGNAILGGWNLGGIVNARSGLPVDVRIVRPDLVYVDGSGNVFTNPAAGRTAIVNTPGGGASRNVRRPDLVPGVDPFIPSGGLLFLNPAAFATPAPGTWGNLERGSIKGPGFRQVDMIIARRFALSGGSNIEVRAEIFNLFDTANFSNPVGTLPLALPASSVTEANKLQPGQSYTAAAAGTFGTLTSTVGRTVGLGTNRQIQFAVRVTF